MLRPAFSWIPFIPEDEAGNTSAYTLDRLLILNLAPSDGHSFNPETEVYFTDLVQSISINPFGQYGNSTTEAIDAPALLDQLNQQLLTGFGQFFRQLQFASAQNGLGQSIALLPGNYEEQPALLGASNASTSLGIPTGKEALFSGYTQPTEPGEQMGPPPVLACSITITGGQHGEILRHASAEDLGFARLAALGGNYLFHDGALGQDIAPLIVAGFGSHLESPETLHEEKPSACAITALDGLYSLGISEPVSQDLAYMNLTTAGGEMLAASALLAQDGTYILDQEGDPILV